MYKTFHNETKNDYQNNLRRKLNYGDKVCRFCCREFMFMFQLIYRN